MGVRMKNIAGLFSNLRTRNIIILTGIILLLVIAVGIVGLRRGSNELESETTLGKIPAIRQTSGLTEVNPEVKSMVESLDQQRYQQAQQSQGSAIPTVLGSGETISDTSSTANNNSNLSTNQATSIPTPAATATNPGGLTPAQIATLQASGQLATPTPQPTNQQAQADVKALQQAKEQTVQNMQRQAKALMASWGGETGTPKQFYQEGQEIKEKTSIQQAATESSVNQAENKTEDKPVGPPAPATIKTGDIVFAVLNTSVNSDEPGPILATIVSGEFKGAKIVGGLQPMQEIPGTNGPEAITLTFNSMNIPELPNTVSINAVAIDPDTARTALASDVDHHYILRYGTLFASSFMQGYGSAITDAGEVIINDPAGGSTQFKQQLTGKQELLAALGNVGQQWGDQMGDTFNRPNTIYVNSGISLGILFLADVAVPINDEG